MPTPAGTRSNYTSSQTRFGHLCLSSAACSVDGMDREVGVHRCTTLRINKTAPTERQRHREREKILLLSRLEGGETRVFFSFLTFAFVSCPVPPSPALSVVGCSRLSFLPSRTHALVSFLSSFLSSICGVLSPFLSPSSFPYSILATSSIHSDEVARGFLMDHLSLPRGRPGLDSGPGTGTGRSGELYFDIHICTLSPFANRSHE